MDVARHEICLVCFSEPPVAGRLAHARLGARQAHLRGNRAALRERLACEARSLTGATEAVPEGSAFW